MAKETYQIFLSSTSADLKLHRDKVREFIERLRLTAIRMETFGARPNIPFKTCELQVKECDALIVIVGKRYGWVPNAKDGGDGRKSITWWEVVWALEARKPVYAFLCDPKSDLESEQDNLVKAKTQKEFIEIGNAVRNLVEFRAFLDHETTRETFTSVDDLAAKVTSSLQVWYFHITEERLRALFKKEKSIAAPALGSITSSQVELHNYDQLYWQEQIHLTSAKYLLANTLEDSEIDIAIIAGKPNLKHPALADATAITHFDMRAQKTSQHPDDYTTGIVALLAGNSNDGTNYKGVIPNTKLSIFQVFSERYVTDHSTLLAAIEAAVVGGNKIICVTLGGGAKSQEYEKVFARAHKLGVIIVCAAGNSTTNKPEYPGAYPHCIAVGATNSLNCLAYFSNFGDWVTTSAPGEDIPIAISKNKYVKNTGTSYACTIATGVIALMLKANKNLTLEEIKKILKSTGTPIYDDKNTIMSFKQIDAFQAVQSALKAESQ